MDNSKRELMRLTEVEIAEFDRMAVILNVKHEALASLNTRMVQQILVEELEELKRIQSVERERGRILKNLSLSGEDLNKRDTLLRTLGEEDAIAFLSLHSMLKKSFTRVTSLNGISRTLLKHSIAFIKQNINILTEGGRRKLVDRKV